jgi:hypothetical protein
MGRKHFSAGANIFHKPQTFFLRRKGWAQTFFIGSKHFSASANICHRAQTFFFECIGWAQTFFHRPQIFPLEHKDLAQGSQSSPIFKAKCARSKAKSKKAKVKTKSSFVFPSSSQNAVV